MQVLACVYYQVFILVSVYLTNSTQFTRHSSVCVCVWFFFWYTCVCHQTRQCMMLSAAEDMRTTIYNSPLSQLRHTVLPRGAGACLCVCVIVVVPVPVCVYATEWEIWEWETVNAIDRARGKELWMTECVLMYVRVCLYVWVLLAEGVSGKKRHVTLDKGEMRGYDWLFSDVTDCEPSQLETIIRCLVTPSVSSPLLYPSRLFSLSLPRIQISSLFVSNFMSLWNFFCLPLSGWFAFL